MFTATQKVTLTDITGYDPVLLGDWLAGITVTPENEAAIQSDIVFWNANFAFKGGVSIEPKESNLGAKINGNEIRNAVIRRVMRRLQMPLPFANSGIGTLQIGI